MVICSLHVIRNALVTSQSLATVSTFPFDLPFIPSILTFFFFFFNDPAPPEIYPLPLHDAFPIWRARIARHLQQRRAVERADELGQPLGGEAALRQQYRRAAIGEKTGIRRLVIVDRVGKGHRSEEHTSELQSPCNLVCRLLLEKKK